MSNLLLWFKMSLFVLGLMATYSYAILQFMIETQVYQQNQVLKIPIRDLQNIVQLSITNKLEV